MFMNHNLYDLCPHMYVEEPVPSKHSGVQLSTMLLSSLNTSYQNSPQCDPGSSKIEICPEILQILWSLLSCLVCTQSQSHKTQDHLRAKPEKEEKP